jgi:flagellar assembly factor FliW
MSDTVDLSALLGDESPPIEFPEGLVGFDEWKHFVLVSHEHGGPLQLLQSLDDDRVSFITTDPSQILSDYTVSLSGKEAHDIGCSDDSRVLQAPWPEDIGVFCVLSVQEEPFSVMANLLGPVVINFRTRTGRQLILSESGYAARYPLAGAAETAAGNGASDSKDGKSC